LSEAVEKEEIRKKVWELLDRSGVSRFPRPVVGRIPNFEGAERAAEMLASFPEFQRAGVVKVNPDSPQKAVRRAVLSEGKVLVMPSPRLRGGFLVLDSEIIRGVELGMASTIRGVLSYGRPCGVEDLPRVDLIVAGSVAVSRSGTRVGKGGGYSEIEYGILRELGLLNEETPIFTTVHNLQIVEKVPKEDHDFLVDAIVTPTKVIRVMREESQPTGIIWEKLTPRMLASMPILRELKDYMKTRQFRQSIEGRV
jgi:5-formyltetrahydrofolate cyclo-ligase